VEAVAGTTSIDSTDEWEIYNLYSTYYEMRADFTIDTDNTYDIEFTIPYDDYSSLLYGGVDSTLICYDSSDNPIYSVDLADLLPSLTGFINVNIKNGFIFSGEYYEVDADIQDTARIILQIVQTFSSPSSSFYIYWADASFITLNFFGYPALFYAYDSDTSTYNTLYDIQYVNDEELPTIPSNPTEMPTALSSFTGWRLSSGVFYDFTSPVTEEMLTDAGELKLYATYIETTPIDTDITIDDNLPDGLMNFLGIFGLDNTAGLLFLFLLINLLIIIGALLIKLPYYIPFMISIVIYGVFIFMGALNIYVIIVLALLYTLVIVNKFLGSD
jgi:hypothetical protein